MGKTCKANCKAQAAGWDRQTCTCIHLCMDLNSSLLAEHNSIMEPKEEGIGSAACAMPVLQLSNCDANAFTGRLKAHDHLSHYVRQTSGLLPVTRAQHGGDCDQNSLMTAVRACLVSS